MLHPDEPASGVVIASLAAGVALFNLSTVFAYWRLHRQLLANRLTVTTITAVAAGGVPELVTFLAARRRRRRAARPDRAGG